MPLLSMKPPFRVLARRVKICGIFLGKTAGSLASLEEIMLSLERGNHLWKELIVFGKHRLSFNCSTSSCGSGQCGFEAILAGLGVVLDGVRAGYIQIIKYINISALSQQSLV
jgi:hypothetical protein